MLPRLIGSSRALLCVGWSLRSWAWLASPEPLPGLVSPPLACEILSRAQLRHNAAPPRPGR